MAFSSGLPYTAEVYFASLAELNADTAPIAAVGVALPVLAVLSARRRPWLSLLLITPLCVSVGFFHELRMMAALNFLAPVHAAGWMAQGALLVWFGVSMRGTLQAVRVSRRGIGGAVAFAGIILYPAGLLVSGVEVSALPSPGLSPQSTALVTAGILLMALERPPLILLLTPLAWSGVSAVSAFLLDFPPDYAVSILLLLASVLIFRSQLEAGRS